MLGKIKVKVGVKYTAFQALHDYLITVVLSMTGNLNFPTPSPVLSSLTSAATALQNAITAWGVVGNRGSHLDYMNLRATALTAYNLLKQEAAYVQNTIDPTATESAQSSFILSSGFSIGQLPSPQGVLNPPQDFRQFFKQNINLHWIGLRWGKPLGLLSKNNVKSFTIYRGLTGVFADATELTTVQKVTYIDKTGLPATTYTYWVVANNSAGQGALSMPLIITTPLA